MNPSLIQRATLQDVDRIMNFIDKEWKKNHILSMNKELLLYEFSEGTNLNFILAKEPDNKIIGFMGFIKTNKSKNPDIWPSFWKVLKTCHPILGLSLLNYLRKQIRHRYFILPGINKSTINIYKGLGMQIGALKQAYIINPLKSNFQIAKINDKNKLNLKIEIRQSKSNYSLKEIRDYKKLCSYINSLGDIKSIPSKDFNYFNKRYLSHPIFVYHFYGIFREESILSVFVCRVVHYGQSMCLRIVDCYGQIKLIKYVSDSILKLIIDCDFEYIDFLHFGFDSSVLKAAGFNFIDYTRDDIILPNYFSPFIRENKEIYFACEVPNTKNFTIYKADGDQDRPN
jgi:hypothetical protein